MARYQNEPSCTQWDNWLEQATQSIQNHPDYASVRQELLDHLEDRAESLRRSAPVLTPQQIHSRVLEGMGEAGAISEHLAEAHSKWLGNLYWISLSLRSIAMGVLALEGAFFLWEIILPLQFPWWPF